VKAAGRWWGAVLVMAHGVTAEAAPKSAVPPVGAAGAAATPPSSAASPTPSAVPAPDASVAPPAPDATAPAPDTATPPPTPPAAEDSSDAAEEEEAEAEEQEPPRKKRVKRRPARVIAAERAEQEPEDAEAPETAPPPVQSWRLAGQAHFLLGIERVTNVLSWSVTERTQVASSNNNFGATPTTVELELERSGTDVSFLGSGAASSNVFGVPRVALDAMLDNGLTLGGSLSYMVVSGKHDEPQGTNKVSRDDVSAAIFVFAPRIGVMIPASPFVGVWLRGGVSRISMSYEIPRFDATSGAQISTTTSTLTLVNLTLDPQLVINPVPHVGITLGALLDIGLSGTRETSGASSQDVTASSYGITGGLVAIF
jgi:hypothetical protein